ncbi:hypothetical protein MARPO_0030s0031 [Marchantia polymorpha]|uniref:Uncharacterized protein n=1 Tax=Marchantia polymorpha TaxID=3197 RepID=A0A2R6X853_MARPO|nr:hypothetical protein MARPO_0030s0031 [Marchantia polymorpha]|eukprot:PTQ42285.1 hypothetical protein MARPO_0030s0031 [Marchantia polymorpha]
MAFSLRMIRTERATRRELPVAGHRQGRIAAGREGGDKVGSGDDRRAGLRTAGSGRGAGRGGAGRRGQQRPSRDGRRKASGERDGGDGGGKRGGGRGRLGVWFMRSLTGNSAMIRGQCHRSHQPWRCRDRAPTTAEGSHGGQQLMPRFCRRMCVCGPSSRSSILGCTAAAGSGRFKLAHSALRVRDSSVAAGGAKT